VKRALIAVSAVALIAVPASAANPTPRTSLTDVEAEVMCLVCHTPLAVSESPQANAERDFIRALIARGESKSQIKAALVAQYGPGVLALPKAHGFNLTIYVLPPVVLLAGLALLAVMLPRWRRRNAAEPGSPAAQPALDPADAQRLDRDLARFD
jgi:cytochrome c-type biogenesis protein CcmH/NrfF